MYSHLNTRPWTAFVGRRTFRGWMQISHVARRRRRSRPLFRAYYVREDTSLTPRPAAPLSPGRRGYRHSRHTSARRYRVTTTIAHSRTRSLGQVRATRRDGGRSTALRSPVDARGRGGPARYEGEHSTWTRRNQGLTVTAPRARVACGMRSREAAVHGGARSRHAERRKSRADIDKYPDSASRDTVG